MTAPLGGFASVVVALDGEPVHATRLRLERTARLRDPGYDMECVLARPDGRRIPGALPIPDGDTCGETERSSSIVAGWSIRYGGRSTSAMSSAPRPFYSAWRCCRAFPRPGPKRAHEPYVRPPRRPRQRAANGGARRQRRRNRPRG